MTAKHLSVKDRDRQTDIIFWMFLIFTGASAFAFIVGDYSLAVTLGVGSSAFGLLFIVSNLAWKSQIGYELQCKIAGVKFEDYCKCKYHRKLKEERTKDQTKL